MACHDDAVVGRDQVLLGAIDDRAHQLLDAGILHRKSSDAAIGFAGLLGGAIDEVVVVFIGFGPPSLGSPAIALFVDHVAAGAVAHRRDLGVGERAHRVVVPVPNPAVLIIDRDPEMSADRVVAARWDHGGAWHDPLGDAPIIVAGFGVAPGPDQQAAWALDHLEMRTHVAERVFVALGAHV